MRKEYDKRFEAHASASGGNVVTTDALHWPVKSLKPVKCCIRNEDRMSDLAAEIRQWLAYSADDLFIWFART